LRQPFYLGESGNKEPTVFGSRDNLLFCGNRFILMNRETKNQPYLAAGITCRFAAAVLSW